MIMDTTPVQWGANAICLVGVAGLLAGHFIIATLPAHQRSGIICSGSGAAIVAFGSALLGSWPVVLLDAIWAWLSFRSLKPAAQRTTIAISDHQKKSLMSCLLVIGIAATLLQSWTVAAFTTSTIYLVAYFFYTHQFCTREGYLFVTLVATMFLLPHLLDVKSYSVLFNETIGVVSSSMGLFAARTTWRAWSQETILLDPSLRTTLKRK